MNFVRLLFFHLSKISIQYYSKSIFLNFNYLKINNKTYQKIFF